MTIHSTIIEHPHADINLIHYCNTEVLDKMHAPSKPDVAIATPASLTDVDGIIFGFPTRFGMMAAQMKAFFDSTGQLWQKGALVGMLYIHIYAL